MGEVNEESEARRMGETGARGRSGGGVKRRVTPAVTVPLMALKAKGTMLTGGSRWVHSSVRQRERVEGGLGFSGWAGFGAGFGPGKLVSFFFCSFFFFFFCFLF